MQKISVITGGASGIGYGIAKVFAEKGVYVVMVGRDKNKLESAVKNLNGNAEYMVCDVSVLSGLPSLVQSVIDKHSKIDILVNNAGIHLKKPMLEITDEEYLNVIHTNQVPVFSLSREVARFMVKNKKGAILNISSMSSIYGIPQVMAYTASKSAIEGMTRAMAVELSPFGIRVNCIAPGFIETEMSAKAFDADPGRKNRVLERTPLNRLGNAYEIAQTAYYLCSDGASFINGTIIPVDGGNSIGF